MNQHGQSMGSASKKRTILIISIVGVALLIIIFLAGKQFVGKAISAPTALMSGEAGILGTETSGDILSVGIGANIGSAESVAFEFELTYPNTVSPLIPINTVAFVPANDWGIDAFSRVTQISSSTLKIEYATLNYRNPLTGAVRLGNVKFTGSVPATDFILSNVRVWSIPATVADPITNLAPTIRGVSGETECTVPTADGSLCGNFCAQDSSRTTYCDYINQCTPYVTCPATGSNYNADLNIDDKYDGQDAQVIFGTRDARNDGACGTTGQSPCAYDLLHVCDDGSFRVTGLTIYNSGAAYVPASQTCPYTMVR